MTDFCALVPLIENLYISQSDYKIIRFLTFFYTLKLIDKYIFTGQ